MLVGLDDRLPPGEVWNAMCAEGLALWVPLLCMALDLQGLACHHYRYVPLHHFLSCLSSIVQAEIVVKSHLETAFCMLEVSAAKHSGTQLFNGCVYVTFADEADSTAAAQAKSLLGDTCQQRFNLPIQVGHLHKVRLHRSLASLKCTSSLAIPTPAAAQISQISGSGSIANPSLARQHWQPCTSSDWLSAP